MKAIRYALMFSTVITVLTLQAKQEPFKVIVQAQWKNLDSNPQRIKRFGGKWILAGSITFKKRSPEMVFLDEIQLTWKGKKINQLTGSLYEKNNMSLFLPIEKYLVCDSIWKQSTQQLFLRFNRPLTLGAVNTFYLVLTVPEELETVLKSGQFSIEQNGLPLPYRDYVKEHELSLTLNTLPQTSTTT